MSAADLFDLDRLPEKERLRYGPGALDSMRSWLGI